MKIVWSERALIDLDDIFQFFVFSASESVAQKMVSKLVSKVKILTSYPEMGVLEDWEVSMPFEYRSLIERNYKIIYRIIEPEIILIARVFDTRRDPKMKRI